jgi:DUF4097 and DUF4098 domain-containing protein YvlB
MVNRSTTAIAVLCTVLFVVTTAGAAHERVEKTLLLEEAVSAQELVRFENLLGSVTVRGGGEPGQVKVEARVVAEADTEQQAETLADSIRLERRDGDEGAVLHVSFPVDDYAAFRMPREEHDNRIARWVAPLLKKFNKKTVGAVYDGRAVQVGQSKGAMALAVHVSVVLPYDVHSSVRQFMGSVECDRLRGELDIENIEGPVELGRVYGTLNARTGAGDLTVLSFRGERADIQTASGTVEVVDIAADELSLRTGSGPIRGRQIKSEAMTVDAQSGAVELEELDTRQFRITSGSGDVDLETRLQRTREATIRSESGDVTLRVGTLAPFDLEARSESGSVKADGPFEVAQREKTEATVHRGTGGANLEVATTSGTVVLKTR